MKKVRLLQRPARAPYDCVAVKQMLYPHAAAAQLCAPPDSRGIARWRSSMHTLHAAGGSGFAAGVRGLCFYLWTLALSLPLFVTMLVMAPIVMLRDKVRCGYNYSFASQTIATRLMCRCSERCCATKIGADGRANLGGGCIATRPQVAGLAFR